MLTHQCEPASANDDACGGERGEAKCGRKNEVSSSHRLSLSSFLNMLMWCFKAGGAAYSVVRKGV